MSTDTQKLNEATYLTILSIGLAFLLLVADYFSGPFIQFPITYLIPISIAAWYNNSRLALVLSILMPLGRFSFNIFFWSVPWTYVEAIVNCSIRIVVFCSFTYLLSKVSLQTQELRSEVEVLSGLLPICANCKKIRDNSNKWQPLESYISQRSEAEFTHGICPDCVEKLYGNVLNKK